MIALASRDDTVNISIGVCIPAVCAGKSLLSIIITYDIFPYKPIILFPEFKN